MLKFLKSFNLRNICAKDLKLHYVIKYICYGSNTHFMLSKGTESVKTTVSFPSNVLKAMRAYMMRENLGLHDQSKVVVEALKEFLTSRGIPLGEEDEELIFDVVQRNYIPPETETQAPQ